MHFKEIDSTNKFLKENHSKYKNLTFVSTDYQSAGKGREDRKWISNPGDNLMFSVLIKDKSLIDQYASLSLLSGYVILKVLESLKIEDVSIKWPNDVYIKDKKACGILMESVSSNNGIDALVIGIGLNVNQEKFETESKAISIYQATNKKHCVRSIKRKVYRVLKQELKLLKTNKSQYLDEVRKHNYLLNKKGIATIDNQQVEVTTIGINDDNSLKVLFDNKELDLRTGEISFH